MVKERYTERRKLPEGLGDVLWMVGLTLRFAICLAAVLYGAVFAAQAKNDFEATCTAIVVGLMIAILLGPKA